MTHRINHNSCFKEAYTSGIKQEQNPSTFKAHLNMVNVALRQSAYTNNRAKSLDGA